MKEYSTSAPAFQFPFQLGQPGGPGGGEVAPQEGTGDGHTDRPVSPPPGLPGMAVLPVDLSGALSPSPPGGGGGSQPAGASPAPCQCRHHRPKEKPALIDQVKNCGQEVIAFKCRNGHGWYAVDKDCKARICVHCERARAMKAYHKYKAVKWRWPLHVVLTLAVGHDLPDLITLALSSWSEVRKHFPQLQKGVRSLEIMPKGADGWYVHLHILADCEWIDGAALEAFWKALTGSYVKKIKRVGNKHSRGRVVADAVREVCKYVAKGLGVLTDDEAYQIYVATFGRRLIHHWGMVGDSKLDTIETKIVCKVCGEALIYDGHMDAVAWKAYYGQFEQCPVIYLDDT